MRLKKVGYSALVLGLILLVLTSVPVWAKEKKLLKTDVHPRFSKALGYATVKAYLVPSEENQLITFCLRSDRGYARISHGERLYPDDDIRIKEYQLLPPGRYVSEVVVKQKSGEIYREKSSFTVTEGSRTRK